MQHPEFVLANKIKLHRDEALELAHQAEEILVSRGKKLLRFRWADGATDEDVAAVILGRSGTLRAPAIRIGQTFVVGFHPEGYTEVFDS